MIPDQGSVGASGDLAPLAHMTAVMIGHGEAMVDGKIRPGAEALASKGLSPVTLGAKEGLALINGTQFSTAYALAGLFQGWRAAQEALVISALSTDAIMGSTAPLEAGNSRLARPAGPDRRGGGNARAAAGFGDPRKPPRGRHPRAGPLLHPLPAAGDRPWSRMPSCSGPPIRTTGGAC